MTSRPLLKQNDDWKGVAVVVTTSRRIFFGYLDPRDIDGLAGAVYDLREARNALRPNVTGGVCQVAVTGPGAGASIEMPCDIAWLGDVKVIRPCSKEAERVWLTTAPTGSTSKDP